jgi:hypothetical protein
MSNGQSPTAPQPQNRKTYEFLSEFERRNALIEAIKFAVSNNCNCEACQKLRIAAEVLEEDRKAGKTPTITP